MTRLGLMARRHISTNGVVLTIVVGCITAIGVILLVSTQAATSVASIEPESGVVNAPAAKQVDSSSSSGQSVAFGASSSISGQAMPVGDIAGWKQVFSDDFNGTSLNTAAGWGKYSGCISSMPGGRWDANRVVVKDSKLQLLAADDGTNKNTCNNNAGGGTWTSGGVANTGEAIRTYGKWLIRMRMDKANGVKYAGLLWPSTGNWPADGEVDFAEDGGGNRTGTQGTTHWLNENGKHAQAQCGGLSIDMSQWQTIGVEWTPGKLVYTINGSIWCTQTAPPLALDAVPDGLTSTGSSYKMFFALQTEVNNQVATQYSTVVDATTPPLVTCEVDWISVYQQQ